MSFEHDPTLAAELSAVLGSSQASQVATDIISGNLLATLYVQIVCRDRFRTHELDARGASSEQVDATLRVMADRGLITRLDEATWLTNPPDRTLTDRAARLEEQAAMIRAAAPGLVQLYYEARARAETGSADSGVQLLNGLDEINAAMGELFSGARAEAYSMRTCSPRVASIIADGAVRVARPIHNSSGDVVRIRATIDSTLLASPNLPSMMTKRIELGDSLRVTPGVPFTATASDTGTVVMDLEDHDTTGTGLRITRPAVCAAIRRVIDDAWVRGVPWATARAATSGGSAILDERDREVLALMASGAADATIGRQLGISQRTVERRIRRMLDRLDANTRFQAGVQAARRGWI